MKVLQALNNNIILVTDDNGNEIVVMGNGVGFNKKKGEMIDGETLNGKKFVLENDTRLNNVISTIPPDIIVMTEEIIEMGRGSTDRKFNDSILVTLADHLRYAIERMEKGLEIANPLQWEIPHLYPDEYRIGEEAVRILEEKYQIHLYASERSYIALHFVNAQYEHQPMDYTLKLTETLSHVIDIVNYHFHTRINELGLNYSRFVAHLRFFIIRQKDKVKETEMLNDDIVRQIFMAYGKSYQCAKKISNYLLNAYNWQVSDSEQVYLILHIERLIVKK